jgi:hypothetical protein
MDGHTFLSWNIPNLITVGLMAAVLVLLLKFGSSVYAKQKAKQGGE